jgi:hypothetical protein
LGEHEHAARAVEASAHSDRKLPFHLCVPVLAEHEDTKRQDEHVQAKGHKLSVVRIGKQHVGDVDDE